VSWSDVARIPIDPVTSSVDHFVPGLAVYSGQMAEGDRNEVRPACVAPTDHTMGQQKVNNAAP